MTVARDDQGRTIGTVHDFRGWCTRPADHEGPHAHNEPRCDDFTGRCGVLVALVGDIENWKPQGPQGLLAALGITESGRILTADNITPTNE